MRQDPEPLPQAGESHPQASRPPGPAASFLATRYNQTDPGNGVQLDLAVPEQGGPGPAVPADLAHERFVRRERPRRWFLPIFLFLATCISTFWAGTTDGLIWPEANGYQLVTYWRDGLLYMAAVLAILLTHEMGHFLQAVRYGVPASLPYFIPMPFTPLGTMGAVIGMKEMPKNVYAEAQMALGGPILGSLGALACLIFWQVTGAPIFVALAFTGFLLNLFNLIPVSPLDGGRAMAAISPWGWLVGLALMVALFLRVQSLMLGFILLVGGMEVFNRWRSRGLDRAYYEATPRQRLTVTLVYFGLAAILVLAMFAVQPHLLGNRPVR